MKKLIILLIGLVLCSLTVFGAGKIVLNNMFLTGGTSSNSTFNSSFVWDMIYDNNLTISDYILYVNSTNGGGTPYDDSWINTTIGLNNDTQNDYWNYITTGIETDVRNYMLNSNVTQNAYWLANNESVTNYADYLNSLSLQLDQSTQQTVVGKPKFKNGIELTDEYGYGYTNFIYTDDYGDLVLDAYTSGSAYICLDPYCGYYIDSSWGYTNLYVDSAYYSYYASYWDGLDSPTDISTSTLNNDVLAYAGDCPQGEAIQNATTTGVECVSLASVGADGTDNETWNESYADTKYLSIDDGLTNPYLSTLTVQSSIAYGNATKQFFNYRLSDRNVETKFDDMNTPESVLFQCTSGVYGVGDGTTMYFQTKNSASYVCAVFFALGGVFDGSTYPTNKDKNVRLMSVVDTRMKMNSVTSGYFTYIGVFNATGSGGYHNNISQASGVFFYGNSTNDEWHGYCCLNGVCTNTSKATLDTNYHTFTIVNNNIYGRNQKGTTYTFYYDDNSLGNCTTTIPDDYNLAEYGIWVENLEDTTSDRFYIDWFYYETNREY